MINDKPACSRKIYEFGEIIIIIIYFGRNFGHEKRVHSRLTKSTYDDIERKSKTQ